MFQKALALEPNSVAAHLNLGMALRETGRSRRRARASATGRDRQPRPTPASSTSSARRCVRTGDLPGAVAAFEKALEIEPEMREGYYALGVALKQQSAAARKPRPPARRVRPTTSYARAQETLARGDLNAAREQLAEALRLDEHHADAHNLLGFILGQQGDLAGCPRPSRARGRAPA